MLTSVSLTGAPLGGRAGGGADVGVLAGGGDPRGGEGPGLGQVEQAVAVGVAADEGGVEVVGRVGRRAAVVARPSTPESGTLPVLVTT